MKIIQLLIAASLLIASPFVLSKHAEQKPIAIGILVPVELPAMQQIVSGFESQLQSQFNGKPVQFLVKNAQGNITIQRAILEEFKTDDVAMVAPIGEDAAQMAIAMIHNKPILGIGAKHLKSYAKKANNPNVTGVLDEVAVDKQMEFVHAALPALKKLTIVYSTDPRIYSKVTKAKESAYLLHLSIQPLMMSQLSDLYSISKNIDADSNAVFIFKDEMIVSGLNTLLQVADQKHIPLIASDDGSVNKGAAFSLGVSENQLGIDAGNLAADILKGKKASELPVHVMSHYFVFLNTSVVQSLGLNVSHIESVAKKLGYPVINE